MKGAHLQTQSSSQSETALSVGSRLVSPKKLVALCQLLEASKEVSSFGISPERRSETKQKLN